MVLYLSSGKDNKPKHEFYYCENILDFKSGHEFKVIATTSFSIFGRDLHKLAKETSVDLLSNDKSKLKEKFIHAISTELFPDGGINEEMRRMWKGRINGIKDWFVKDDIIDIINFTKKIQLNVPSNSIYESYIESKRVKLDTFDSRYCEIDSIEFDEKLISKIY